MSNQQKQVSQAGQSTFVATIRADLRMIASIARLMESEGDHAGTLGKVASEAIRILSSMSQKVYPVETYEKAIMELRRMGYNDPMAKGTRHYTAIQKKLGFEQEQKEGEKEMLPIVEEFKKEINANLKPLSEEGREIAEERMGIFPKQPKRTINISKDAPKNKIHTHLRSEADEQRAIKEQNAGFAGPPPLAEVSPEVSPEVNAVDKPSQPAD